MSLVPKNPSSVMHPVPRRTNDFTSEAVLVITCSALALYSAIELLLMIFTTFKRWTGLYFWSMLIATTGIIPYNIGYLIVYFDLTKNYAGFIIDSIGWAAMITGQSVVLYSRLHIILRNQKILRGVLYMIIFNGVVWHTTTTVVLFGAYLSPDDSFMRAYNVIEKLQMTIFCLQEFIISGLYVWKTSELLKNVYVGGGRQATRGTMFQLFFVNVIIIILDIALLALEYKNLLVLEQGFKSVIYAAKLKLEFAILGKLVSVVQNNDRSQSGSNSRPKAGEIRRTTTTTVVASTTQSAAGRKERGSKWYKLGEQPEGIHMDHMTINEHPPSPRMVTFDSKDDHDRIEAVEIQERESSEFERQSKASKNSDVTLFRSISKQGD
ncbi:hypothetical protein BU16DRAFT_199769 [Lophium mytilinum]|uniref:DUF7703 domain-containing protein n=1 Tax=Lophium mytilinum TaxID=390894 RepID=A0A6A6R9M4_9PEZI|nr:hypothetical protein BU16DRAFT_199769 [Lophium mytilinum]